MWLRTYTGTGPLLTDDPAAPTCHHFGPTQVPRESSPASKCKNIQAARSSYRLHWPLTGRPRWTDVNFAQAVSVRLSGITDSVEGPISQRCEQGLVCGSDRNVTGCGLLALVGKCDL